MENNGQEQTLKDLSQAEPTESLEEVKAPFMRSRELALLSVFSALWIAAQLTLGPVLGRFSIGRARARKNIIRMEVFPLSIYTAVGVWQCFDVKCI